MSQAETVMDVHFGYTTIPVMRIMVDVALAISIIVSTNRLRDGWMGLKNSTWVRWMGSRDTT